MQIDSIASIVASNSLAGTLAAITQVTANGKAQVAVVERVAGGYEAYVPDRIGPVANGSSIAAAEARLNSTVEFQA